MDWKVFQIHLEPWGFLHKPEFFASQTTSSYIGDNSNRSPIIPLK